MAKRGAQAPASELRVSVITALITGSVIAHVMRGVNPIMEGFKGTVLPLKPL